MGTQRQPDSSRRGTERGRLWPKAAPGRVCARGEHGDRGASGLVVPDVAGSTCREQQPSSTGVCHCPEKSLAGGLGKKMKRTGQEVLPQRRGHAAARSRLLVGLELSPNPTKAFPLSPNPRLSSTVGSPPYRKPQGTARGSLCERFAAGQPWISAPPWASHSISSPQSCPNPPVSLQAEGLAAHHPLCCFL